MIVELFDNLLFFIRWFKLLIIINFLIFLICDCILLIMILKFIFLCEYIKVFLIKLFCGVEVILVFGKVIVKFGCFLIRNWIFC